jgi:hypothetical protein
MGKSSSSSKSGSSASAAGGVSTPQKSSSSALSKYSQLITKSLETPGSTGKKTNLSNSMDFFILMVSSLCRIHATRDLTTYRSSFDDQANGVVQEAFQQILLNLHNVDEEERALIPNLSGEESKIVAIWSVRSYWARVWQNRADYPVHEILNPGPNNFKLVSRAQFAQYCSNPPVGVRN